MPKSKPKKRAFLVEVDEKLYQDVSLKSVKEGWKVATLLRKFLTRLANGDEAAEYIRDVPDDE